MVQSERRALSQSEPSVVLIEDEQEASELTAPEREILQLICQGYRDHDIAQGLYVSEKTVQKHVQSILSKLGVRNRTEAAYLLHCHG